MYTDFVSGCFVGKLNRGLYRADREIWRCITNGKYLLRFSRYTRPPDPLR